MEGEYDRTAQVKLSERYGVWKLSHLCFSCWGILWCDAVQTLQAVAVVIVAEAAAFVQTTPEASADLLPFSLVQHSVFRSSSQARKKVSVANFFPGPFLKYPQGGLLFSQCHSRLALCNVVHSRRVCHFCPCVCFFASSMYKSMWNRYEVGTERGESPRVRWTIVALLEAKRSYR